MSARTVVGEYDPLLATQVLCTTASQHGMASTRLGPELNAWRHFVTVGEGNCKHEANNNNNNNNFTLSSS